VILSKRSVIIGLLLLLSGVFSPVFAATPVMVQKNLFSEDRKPPLPQSGSAPSESMGQGMAIGNIQLDGVVFRDNAKKAILRLKNIPMRAVGATGNPASPFVTVRIGEMVNEYRVAKIDVQSVTLERSGQLYTIGLFSANKVAAPASPQPSYSSAPSPNARMGQPPMQAARGTNAGLPHGPVFQNGFRPTPPRQALHGRMPAPPSQGPANLPSNGNSGQGTAANR
jgi:hypothetical protein